MTRSVLSNLLLTLVLFVQESGGKAKKVFLTRDAVGQSYLALLLPGNSLNLVKVQQ